MFKYNEKKISEATFVVTGKLLPVAIRRSQKGHHYLNVGVLIERDGIEQVAYGPVMLEGPADYQLATFLKAVGLEASTGVDKGAPQISTIPGWDAVFLNASNDKLELPSLIKIELRVDTFNGIQKLKINKFLPADRNV